MNKKGFLAEALVDFYSYLAFILIIIIFFLLLSMQKCQGPAEQEMIGSFEENDAGIILLNYLRTPVSLDKKQIDFAELISLTYSNKKGYKDYLFKQTQIFFKELNFIKGWKVEIDQIPFTMNRCKGNYKKAEAIIPSQNKPLKVVFYQCEKGLEAISPSVM